MLAAVKTLLPPYHVVKERWDETGIDSPPAKLATVDTDELRRQHHEVTQPWIILGSRG